MFGFCGKVIQMTGKYLARIFQMKLINFTGQWVLKGCALRSHVVKTGNQENGNVSAL